MLCSCALRLTHSRDDHDLISLLSSMMDYFMLPRRNGSWAWNTATPLKIRISKQKEVYFDDRRRNWHTRLNADEKALPGYDGHSRSVRSRSC